MTATFTRLQKRALRLLARGGVRYGTQITEMRQLRDMGLCYAHDKGEQPNGKGRWTWRPTDEGRRVIAEMGLEAMK